MKMNIKIPKEIYTSYVFRLALLAFIFCCYIAYTFDYSWRETTLLFFAAPTMVTLLLVFVKPAVMKVLRREADNHKAITRDERRIMKAMKKGGRKPHNVGDYRQHVVSGRDFYDANKRYLKFIKPIEHLNPKKEYWYASETENNLDEK